MKNKFPLLNHLLSKLSPSLLYQSVFFFFVASVSGYIWEVLLTCILNGTLCNRGFLYGPWLPIYGFGALFLSLLLNRFSSHPMVTFFLSAILGSLLELITGLAFSTYWHTRYWDYSALPFHIEGYVSLLSFLGFGFAGSFWICFLSPRLAHLWSGLPRKFHKHLTYIFLTIFLLDYLISLFVPNTGQGITF